MDDNNLKPFSWPIHGIGLRIVLPPIPNEQNEYNIRIESLLSEMGKIFLENQARYIKSCLKKYPNFKGGKIFMTLEQKIAQLFRMDEKTRRRHANPWSVFSRFSMIPLISLAFWSRIWLGWWSLVPIIIITPLIFFPR